MAQFRHVDATAKQRLKHRTKGYQDREPYREAVMSLRPGMTLELEPEQGESLRKIKLNLSRAAKETGRSITYGDSRDDTILAWLEEAEAPPRKRRGRPPKSPQGTP